MRFKLYACCVPVRGAKRSLIQDLQRNTYKFIPNILCDILTRYEAFSADELKSFYGDEYTEYIDSYIEFLLHHDLGFWCEDAALFPAIDQAWESPSKITNAIIDIDSSSNHNYAKLAQELDALGCKALQLRFYEPCEQETIKSILLTFSLSRLLSIDLLVTHTPDIDLTWVRQLCDVHARISSVIVHSAPGKSEETDATGIGLTFTDEHILDHSFCGVVHPAYFCGNTDMYIESRRFNNCLNRKISVDVAGTIRNCPSLPASFGNSLDTSLQQAVASPTFQEVWSITKDQVAVCKDCEFRYMCLDCRAHLQDAANRLSKPAKCQYDPYVAQWQEPQNIA